MDWMDGTARIVDFVSGLIGIAGAVMAAWAWREAQAIHEEQLREHRRRSEKIRLMLIRQSDGSEHLLNYLPRRDQATRAELLGILGMYMGQQRFESALLVPILEGPEFDEVMSGATNTLRLPMPDREFDSIRNFDQRVNASPGVG